MQEAPIAPDDPERVASLSSLGLLDTDHEERFDRITRLASLALGMPIALVSLVDADRQWFKSRVGLEASETPRSVSFCGHALHSDAPLVVEDALADPRFADNPLVVGAPHVRSYLGFPLDDGKGHKVGTLCVIDHEAQTFSATQLELMSELAALAAIEVRSIGLERALRDRDQLATRATVIAEAVNDALVTIDRHGSIQSFNAAAERMFGHPRAEAIGRPVALLGLDGQVAPGARPALSEVGQSPATSPIHRCEAQHANGSVVPVEISVNEVTIDDEVVSVWLARDISERVAVDRIKSEFVSVVSHELRTPLTAIRGALGLLAGGALGPIDTGAQRMVDIAVSNTDRLVRLINDILDLERIESGKVNLELAGCDSAELVSAAIDTARPLADRAEITLETDVAPLPLVVDADQIVRVLTNLLSNAIKFSPPGGAVHVSTTDGGTCVAFRVADRGRGIPADKLASVFDRFEQVDASDSRDKGGTGLGLAICKTIVELHGGTIGVDSTLGEGSTFTFTLPKPASSDEHTPARAPGHESGLDVLVCDGDPDVRETMTAILEAANCRVAATGSGDLAIGLAQRRRPDVILLDPGSPGLNGWQTVARLQADPDAADIPIVIVASARTPGTGDRGVHAWVEKPVRPPALLRAVYSAVRRGPGPARVLVVEDDADLGRVLGGVLSENGIESHVVATVEAALTVTSVYRPELLVLDLNLPDGSGLDVVDSLHERHQGSTMPSLVYTAGPIHGVDRERGDRHRTRFLLKGVTNPQGLAHNVLQLLLAYAGRGDRTAA